MDASYPELNPPQYANFPIPIEEMPTGGSLIETLSMRIDANILHAFAFLCLFGILIHHLFFGYQLFRNSIRHNPLFFLLWLVPLFFFIITTQERSETLKFLLADLCWGNFFYTVVLTWIFLSRPGQLFIELITYSCASLLGNSRHAWWLVITSLLPILGSLVSMIAVIPIALRLLDLHVFRGAETTWQHYGTKALFFVNLSIGAGITINSGGIAPMIELELPLMWSWVCLLTIFTLSIFGFLAVYKKFKYGNRILDTDELSERKTLPAWSGWFTGCFLPLLIIFRENFGWLVILAVGFSITERFLSTRRPQRTWPYLLTWLSINLVWIPLGKLQSWWIDSLSTPLNDFSISLISGIVSILLGLVPGISCSYWTGISPWLASAMCLGGSSLLLINSFFQQTNNLKKTWGVSIIIGIISCILMFLFTNMLTNTLVTS